MSAPREPLEPVLAGALKREGKSMPTTLHPLSRHEIERRINRLAAELARSYPADGGPANAPRWITASELIARVRPFLVYN